MRSRATADTGRVHRTGAHTMSRLKAMLNMSRAEQKRAVVASLTGDGLAGDTRLPRAASERRAAGWVTRGIVVQGARRRSGRRDVDMYRKSAPQPARPPQPHAEPLVEHRIGA